MPQVEQISPLCDNWKYKVAVSSAQYDYVEYGPNAFPSLLFNAMIHPLVGLGMKGVIWYQGENNAARANEYIDLFPALITDFIHHPVPAVVFDMSGFHAETQHHF